MDFSNMEAQDWLVGIGGIVMFFAVFFHFWGVGFLLPVIGLLMVALVILDKLADVPAVRDFEQLSLVYIIGGAVATAIAALSLLNLLFWLHGLISVVWYMSPILELLASIAVLIGGVMKRREYAPSAGYQQQYQQPQQPPYQQPPYQQPPQQQPPQQQPYQAPPQQPPYQQPPPQQPPYQPPPPPQGGPGAPPPPPPPAQ